MPTQAEYNDETKKLRNDPMVNAWITEYQKDKWNRYHDCRHCGWPHSPNLMCGSATFGHLTLGRERYAISWSNVVWFHDFMSKTLGVGWGFHWRDETYFKRDDKGGVEVKYIESFNNHPQVRGWRIPPNEWASIVCSVSKDGETGDRWNAAQDFHGRPE